MKAINRDTGTVTWDDYLLYSGLLHDTFSQLYPHLTQVRNFRSPHGIRERIYHFPTVDMDGFPLMLEVVYYNQRLSGIYIRRIASDTSDDGTKGWWQQLPRWIKIAEKWLEAQLGQPHEIKPGVLLDEEEFLTPDEILLLQSWSYNFEWGSAGFYYDGLQMPGEIYVHYDYHQQIRNWDELAAECELLLQNQLEHYGMYVGNLLATRSLIDVVRPYFDFQKVKPKVYVSGLGFPLPVRSTTVVVEVQPSAFSALIA